MDNDRKATEARLNQFRILGAWCRLAQDPEVEEEEVRGALVETLDLAEMLLNDNAALQETVWKAYGRAVDIFEWAVKDLPKKPAP